LRTTLPDPATGKPVEHVTVFSEYRDVAGYGLKWPMRVTTWRDGQPFVETEVTNVRPLETLAEDVLTRP
jgi:hypothetical protein